MGRQHQGMDGPGVRQVPEGSGEQGKMEKTGCKIICGAPTTLAVKGLMMMMMTSAPAKEEFSNKLVYNTGTRRLGLKCVNFLIHAFALARTCLHCV